MQITNPLEPRVAAATDADSPLAISVVIPCFNCIETIDRALDSVLNQTKQPAEIILVEDCSSDGTFDRLSLRRSQYPDLIKIIQMPENSGPGLARNAGWDQSQQPWIAFLDADDVWHPQKLELQANWIKSNPDAILCGHLSRQLNQTLDTYSSDPISAKRVTLAHMLISNRFPTRSVMVRREVSLRFCGKAFSEDYLLWLQIIAEGMPSYVMHACLAYSIRPDFSAAGFSGQLWRQEKRELASLKALYLSGAITSVQYLLASAWSLLKYPRRLLIQRSQD